MVFEIEEIISLFKLGYTKQALTFLSRSFQKRKSKELSKDAFLKLYSLSQETLNKHDYKSAIQLLSLLEDKCQKLNDTARLIDLKNSLSLSYRLSGSPSESLSKCLEALDLVSQHPEVSQKLPALHLNACAIYRENFQDLTNAKLHAKLAYLTAKSLLTDQESTKRTLAVSLYNYGFICDVSGDYKHAQEWYEEALQYCSEHWQDQGMIDCLHLKHTSLINKMRLLTRRCKNESSFFRKGAVLNSRKTSTRRMIASSQCSRRTKKLKASLNSSNLRSVSSNEKSTDHSVGPFEKAMKIRKARVIPDIFVSDEL